MCRPMPFKNTEAGAREGAVAWLEGRCRVAASDVVVGMEATGHWMACYSFLVARGYSVAVINPIQVSGAQAQEARQGQNDRIDAWLIAETL